MSRILKHHVAQTFYYVTRGQPPFFQGSIPGVAFIR